MISLAVLRLLAILLLVGANAFFVAAEFSLVSIRDTRLQELIEGGRTGARAVFRLHQNLDQLLSAVQFGVTLTSLGLGWAGESALARLLLPAFSRLPHGGLYAHSLALVLSFAIITYLHVTLGEVVPKAVALQRAERVALAVARPMDVFMILARPALFVLSRSAALVLRVFRIQPMREAGVHSPEELKLIATASRHVGVLHPLEEALIHRTLELGDVLVREIMTPRHQIFSVSANMTLEEAMVRVAEEQYSRIPVYDPERGPEHIIGMLYAKELMRWMQFRLLQTQTALHGAPPLRVRNIMRDVLVVPESKSVSALLPDFKQRKRQMAVVVDEFGSTTGLVTVEDVLEQLVGEIDDEFAVRTAVPPPSGAGLVLSGSTSLRDLEMQYQITLPRDGGFETLAGFMLSQLQKLPKGGETFEYQHRRFSVAATDRRRIALVRVESLPDPTNAGVQPE